MGFPAEARALRLRPAATVPSFRIGGTRRILFQIPAYRRSDSCAIRYFNSYVDTTAHRLSNLYPCKNRLRLGKRNTISAISAATMRYRVTPCVLTADIYFTPEATLWMRSDLTNFSKIGCSSDFSRILSTLELRVGLTARWAQGTFFSIISFRCVHVGVSF